MAYEISAVAASRRVPSAPGGNGECKIRRVDTERVLEIETIKAAELTAVEDVGWSPAPILTCEGLTKYFGRFRAVANCSISILRGSITGLVGPNGAGKTTLLNLIAGTFLPTSGRTLFDDEDISTLAPNERFARGLVRTFQIPHEFQHLSVLENLMMVAPGQRGENLLQNWFAPQRVRRVEEEVRRRAWNVLDFIELAQIASNKAGLISGGQKKLLELGRTMMTDAKLVLLDEPAAGVNRTLLRKVEEKISYLNKERGYTFILVEHDMEVIERLCDPVICMADGSVLIEGDFRTVRTDARVLEAYLGEQAGVEE